jgi:hypothetical protein
MSLINSKRCHSEFCVHFFRINRRYYIRTYVNPNLTEISLSLKAEILVSIYFEIYRFLVLCGTAQ